MCTEQRHQTRYSLRKIQKKITEQSVHRIFVMREQNETNEKRYINSDTKIDTEFTLKID